VFALKCERVSARYHKLTEMSPDWNGPDRNGPRPKLLRPNRPDRKVANPRSQILCHSAAKM